MLSGYMPEGQQICKLHFLLSLPFITGKTNLQQYNTGFAQNKKSRKSGAYIILFQNCPYRRLMQLLLSADKRCPDTLNIYLY